MKRPVESPNQPTETCPRGIAPVPREALPRVNAGDGEAPPPRSKRPTMI
jgi:hypothetical protein